MTTDLNTAPATRPTATLSRRLATTLLAGLAACTLLPGAQAQTAATFPNKPVRILTGFPVGSGPEGVLRIVAEKLSKTWGQPVVVENRPGANGFLAIGAFKQGNTEGYDLIQLDNVHLVAYPHMFKKLPYDPVKDFEPLAPLFKAYFFVAVASNSPYKNVGDLIKDAKANPGKLNYGSWSIGNPVHLGSALFESTTGTEMVHVVYKETSQLYTAVATGELNWALGSSASSGALQRAGRIKYLAVASPKRLAAFPDVPTMAEAGGPANTEVSGWTAIAAPKGIPKDVADKIQRDIAKALAEPDVAQRFATFGYEQFPVTRPEFAQYIQAESAKFQQIVQRAKVQLD